LTEGRGREAGVGNRKEGEEKGKGTNGGADGAACNEGEMV